jgi:hypothetical protein
MTHEVNPDVYEYQTLMVVQTPRGVNRQETTLHKVKITSSIFAPEISKDGLDKYEEPRSVWARDRR